MGFVGCLPESVCPGPYGQRRKCCSENNESRFHRQSSFSSHSFRVTNILPPPAAWIHRCRRFARNQFRRDRQRFRVILASLQALEQNPRRGFAHVAQRLANCRKPRIVIRSRLNIVKSNYRNVFRHAQIRVAQRANCSNRNDIVERYDRWETPTLIEQLLDNWIAKLRRSQVALQLNREIRANFQPKFTRDADDTSPAIVRVGAERLPAHERDLPVPELVQMPQ